MKSVLRSCSALVAATTPTSFHVAPPSVENCHAPFAPVNPVIAIPLALAASTSVALLPRNVEICTPAFATSSSVSVGREGFADAKTGASFTAVTVIDAVFSPLENDVEPPLVTTLAVDPGEPAVRSHAR